MKNASSIVGLAAAICLAPTACTGGGGESGTAEPSGSPGEGAATEERSGETTDGATEDATENATDEATHQPAEGTGG